MNPLFQQIIIENVKRKSREEEQLRLKPSKYRAAKELKRLKIQKAG